MSHVVIVTGLSGSGKSTALRALEDLGYFCIDNMPVLLVPKVLELASAADAFQRVGFVMDARDKTFLVEAGPLIDRLRDEGVGLDMVFLKAREETLIKRFQTTRRRHPLASGGDVRQAIEDEDKQLAPLRDRADLTIDTSDLTVHELKSQIQNHFAGEDTREMRLRLLSFGFRYGMPTEADIVLDVRFLANPYFVPELKDQTGLQSEVSGWVLGQAAAQEFVDRAEGFLSFLLPLYRDEGKAYLTVAIGCTGGQHRSVTIVEELARRLAASSAAPIVEHRERDEWRRLTGRHGAVETEDPPS